MQILAMHWYVSSRSIKLFGEGDQDVLSYLNLVIKLFVLINYSEKYWDQLQWVEYSGT